jgi:murein DD-endopeptidase MepM/ murein hydrolase activator NlpD
MGMVLAASHGIPARRAQSEPITAFMLQSRIQHATTRVNLTLPLPERLSSPREIPAPHVERSSASTKAALINDVQKSAALDNWGGEWREVTVRTGDTLSTILSRLNIGADLQSLMQLGAVTRMLDSIYPGQELYIRVDNRGMKELIFDPDDMTRLNVVKTKNGSFKAERQKLAVKTRQFITSGTIKHSLYLDGRKAGLSDPLIMKLSELFRWDIDFALDIREGDTFTIIYEKYCCKGKELDDGDIIAAEFTNQGKVFRALRYTDSKGHTGYYTVNGRSMRRPFLRTPVEIARISSPFDLHRWHPILHTIRAHKGIDYAAPAGTPIKATGDGTVTQRGSLGGYGNTITLQHSSQYTTLYGHMSRFANNTSVGQRVQQGQVIGYIGSTGLATGPHVHYEVRVDGVPHNPLTIKLLAAQPLPKSEMARFLSATKPLLAQLHIHTHNHFAMN